MTKTIKGRMSEIVEQTEELKRLINEPTTTLNKIWVPTVGVVKLWEMDNKK